MGYIARAQLASAVSNAGALGIIETSSGELDQVRDEINKMRDLTDKPFGVNIAQLFVRDLEIVDFVARRASASSPPRPATRRSYTDALHEAGHHRVPRRAHRCARALKAIACRRRRARRRGRRGRRLQGPPRRRHDGAAAARLLAGGRAGDRGRRDLRRPLDGGGVRARRRGRADGDPHGLGGRVARAHQLQAARSWTRPRPTPCSSTGGTSRASGCWRRRSARTSSSRTSGSGSRRSTGSSTSTSGATSTPRSRSAARWRGASTRSARSPRSSTSTISEFYDTIDALGQYRAYPR